MARLGALAAKTAGTDAFGLTNYDQLKANSDFLVVAGADLASATSVAITARFHKITGGVTIDTITDALGATKGQRVAFLFASSLTVRDNGGGSGNIRVGGADIVVYANEIVDFAYDGALWRIASRSVPQPAPIFRGALVYHDADQTNTSSESTLAFNSEDKDTAAFHDPASNTRLTIPTGYDGTYEIEAYVPVTAVTAGVAGIAAALRKNGTVYLTVAAGQAGSDWTQDSVHPPAAAPRWVGDLVATDYVEVRVASKGGSNTTIGGRTGTDPSRGAMFRIHQIG